MCAACGIATHVPAVSVSRTGAGGATRFAALRNGDCRDYLVGASLSMMGDSIEHVISYWVMFQQFHSPALAGFAVISHWATMRSGGFLDGPAIGQALHKRHERLLGQRRDLEPTTGRDRHVDLAAHAERRQVDTRFDRESRARAEQARVVRLEIVDVHSVAMR